MRVGIGGGVASILGPSSPGTPLVSGWCCGSFQDTRDTAALCCPRPSCQALAEPAQTLAPNPQWQRGLEQGSSLLIPFILVLQRCDPPQLPACLPPVPSLECEAAQPLTFSSSRAPCFVPEQPLPLHHLFCFAMRLAAAPIRAENRDWPETPSLSFAPNSKCLNDAGWKINTDLVNMETVIIFPFSMFFYFEPHPTILLAVLETLWDTREQTQVVDLQGKCLTQRTISLARLLHFLCW